MIRVFEEHEEFSRFTRFDTTTGQLTTIGEDEFCGYLPEDWSPAGGYLTRVEGRGAIVFTGATPETHVRFPRRIYFQITRDCNLACDYCFIKAGCGQPHVPVAGVYRIAELMGAHGLMEVRLTGGEPTRHPEFLDIMRKFKAEGVYVSVATNGCWERELLDAFCAEPHLWIICSVDGGRQTHDRYRPGTFDRIVANLRELKSRNPSARIRLTTVLTSRNKGQMLDIGRLCAEVGAESVTVIPLRPQVRVPGIRDEMVSGSEFKQVIEDLIEAKRRYGVPFTTTMETDYKDAIHCDPIVRKRSSCAAGREATNLDYDAVNQRFVVYACSYSPASDLEADPSLRRPFTAGTFALHEEQQFVDIWRRERAWEIYRDLTIRSDACLRCAYLASRTCTGSCPIQNVDYESIDARSDVLDQLKDQIRHTAEWYCYQTIAPTAMAENPAPSENRTGGG